MTAHALERIAERLPGADPESVLAAIRASSLAEGAEPFLVDATGSRLWHHRHDDGRGLYGVERDGVIATVLAPGMTAQAPEGPVYLDHDGRRRSAGPGFYPEWTEAEYHGDPCARPALSASLAWTLHQGTPVHAWAASPRLNPWHESEERKDFDLGTAVHEVLTGRGGGVEVIDCDEFRTKESKAARDAARAEGKTPLSRPQARQVNAIVASVRRQFDGADPFADPEGESEAAIVWESEGVLCRALIDRLDRKRRIAWDLKTTGGSAEPEAWLENAMRTTGIDLRVAHYLEGLEATFGGGWRYRIIPVETAFPHPLSLLALSESAIHYGARKLREARRTWRRCVEDSRWPGYSADLAVVTPRAYHETKQLEREEAESDRKRKVGGDLLARARLWQAPPPGTRAPE